RRREFGVREPPPRPRPPAETPHGARALCGTADLDHGPIVIQAAVPVKPADDAERLAARVLAQEHRIYPQAVRWLLDGKLAVEDGVVRVRAPGARQWLLADD